MVIQTYLENKVTCIKARKLCLKNETGQPYGQGVTYGQFSRNHVETAFFLDHSWKLSNSWDAFLLTLNIFLGFLLPFCLFPPLKTHIRTHIQLVLAPGTRTPCDDY